MIVAINIIKLKMTRQHKFLQQRLDFLQSQNQTTDVRNELAVLSSALKELLADVQALDNALAIEKKWSEL